VRYIFQQIFLGSGSYSLQQIRTVFFRLDDAFSHLSGMQQNGGMGTEFSEEYQQKNEEEIKDILRDVICAFGFDPGCVEFKKQKLPPNSGPIANKLLEDAPDENQYAHISFRPYSANEKPPDPKVKDNGLVGIIKFDMDCDRLYQLARLLCEKF